jgi:tripartite-type tricarboxylate transporter receptor subunit TctC
MNVFQRRFFSITACVLLAAPLSATAQLGYPNRPVRIIVPFTPGSGTDIVARIAAEHLTKSTGQAFVVENRQGADGALGSDNVAKAPPDGYLLGVIPASPIVMNPALYKLPFDPIKDLVPVSSMASLGFVLTVSPSLPVRNVQELVAHAKANPGKLNYAAGSTVVHLAGELFKLATGTDIVAIPYKGTAPQVTAVLANEVAMTFDPFLGFSHVKAGKLRPIAVTSSKRSSLLPEIPTLQEAGLKDYVVETWIGMFAPGGTPKPIVELLQKEVIRIVALPEVKERLAGLSYEPVGSTSEQFAAQIAADTAMWAKTVKDTNFKVTK